MNAIQRNEKLRIPQFHNEWVEVVAFQQRKSGHQWPDAAEFKTGDYMKTAVVYLQRDDYPAFKHAGFDLRGRFGPVDVPIDVLIQNDRVAAVRGLDGTEYEVERREAEPALQIVTNAMPAHNPDNGEPPAPLAYVEPEPIEPRRRDDDGNGFGPGKSRLYAKMAQVMGKLQRIPKSGHNKHFDYKFVTEADIADAVRVALSEVGLAFFSEIVSWERKDLVRIKTYNNKIEEKPYVMTRVEMRFTFACADTGETIDRRWFGEAEDDSDKGISKAVTLAEKYFLKTTFVISTGDPADDPDSGTPAESQSSSGVSKRKSPKQAVEDVQTGTAVIHFIEVRVSEDKPDKPYIVGEGGYVTFTRQPFREGSIPCESWDKPGKYDLPAKVLITYKVKGSGPKEITGATWAEDLEAESGAAKSGVGVDDAESEHMAHGTAGTDDGNRAKRKKASDLDRLPDDDEVEGGGE